MTTTSITSGTDFIGKTLIIGSTGLVDRDYSYILDFNNNSTNYWLLAAYQSSNQRPSVGFRHIGYLDINIIYNYTAQTNVYYIYVVSFISTTQIRHNIYEYDGASTIISKGTTITTFNTPNTFLSSLTQFWLGKSIYNLQYYYSGTYDKVALYNGNIFALNEANILSTLLTVVRSTQTNIINNNTYIFRSLGTNFLGVVVNILNYNATPGSSVTNSNITLIGSANTTGGYLNIIGSYIETATTPDAPTNVIATAGNAQFTITWTASTYDGGSPIIGYNVSTNAGYFQLATFVDSSTTTATFTEIPFTEVPIGTAFTFIVVAINAIGNSGPASSLSITLIRTPNAPTNVTASAGNTQVTLNWTAPTYDGYSAITSYSVTSSPGNFQATTPDGLTTTATVSGLTNGIAYAFIVVAKNAAGSSPGSIPIYVATYENFNSSSSSFRIFCDKLTSNDIYENLILESTNNNIEFKVAANKKIIFNNPIVLNNAVNLNNKGLTGLTTISAENLSINTEVLNTNINIVYKSFFNNNSIYSNTFITNTTILQDLSNSLFSTIDISNNSSILVNVNITLYYSYAINEPLTVELWRDTSMIVQSKNLGCVNSAGGIITPYSLTYLDTSLNAGPKKYYIKYKLENNISLIRQGIINLFAGSDSNIILTEIENASNYYNKLPFTNSSYTTTSYEIQDLSAVLYNIIDVSNTNVHVAVSVNLYCSYSLNEQIIIEVWRDASMIVQSKKLGTVNATAGLTIPYNFNYLDTNLSDGPKKYYLKYKLEKDPSSNASVSAEPQGIVNISTSNSIGTSNILLTNVPKNNGNLTRMAANSFLTSTSDLQDLSGQLYTNIDIGVPSSVLVDLNFTLYACYAGNERITIQLWRDLFMVSENLNIGTTNATGGSYLNFRLSLLDEMVSGGLTKYYIKYKLETNYSAQPQGIIDVQGTYTIIEDYNRGILLYYKILSYNVMDYENGYVKNTSIGYNPIIVGDKGAASGRRPAHFTYIDASGAASSFNNSLYVKSNLFVDGSASITSDLSVNAFSQATMLSKLSLINDYINNMANTSATEFSNNSISTRDLSAHNITVSNELYALAKYYTNDLNINGQLLSGVLRVPQEFTLDLTNSNSVYFIPVTDGSWVQMGSDIDGDASNDYAGRVSLNADGTILAIAATGNNSSTGKVKIYQYNNNANDPSWIQMGPNINGEASLNLSGYSISLNAAGNILAIGAPYNDGTIINNMFDNRGHVRLYQYNNNPNDPSWIQMGPDIDGEASGDESGFSLSLNDNGTIVAIGATYNDGTVFDSNRGHVRVYQYNNVNDPSWIQLGPDIDGEVGGDRSGTSISLNAAGNILAIGAEGNDGNGDNSGHVRIYQYNNNINDPSWIQMGRDIDGDASNNYAARVSLNAVGTIVAIGALGNNSFTGKVKIYQYNNNIYDPSWIQLGQDIVAEAPGDYCGSSVSLNAEGTILAIGSPYNDGTINDINDNRGHVRLYQYNNNANDPSWIQLGRTIYGETPGDRSGHSVSLNDNGNIVAIGALFNYANGTGLGHVRIYQYQETTRLIPVTTGSLIINGDLIVRGNRKIIKSSIVDISSFTVKVATNLRNKADLSSNPSGLDVSNVASLKYDGSSWNISGGNLLIGNLGVGYDVSLINLQTTISASLIASKIKYDTSFSLLQTNIDNSFNKMVYYTNRDVDNSFSTYTDFSNLKNYIDLSFVTKQMFSISGNAIVQNYVSKAYIDGSFIALNNKQALFALKKSVEISYNDLSGQIIRSFANVSATNVDISSITIDTIKTPRLTLTSHVLINGDLVVAGDTSSNSLAISNSFTFSNNGYSSVYFTSSSPTAIMEQYFSKFNNYGISVFYISADGSLYNLNNSRGAISDSRLKENIVDASPKLEDLLKVRIVDYNLKANSSKKYIGVLAQELEELFPSLVETESMSAHDIETDKTIQYKSVKYSCFNVMLIKALQEQQQIIDNLTLRLERLKEKKRKEKEIKERKEIKKNRD